MTCIVCLMRRGGHLPRRDGFTLVELLVVIAIIALLVGVLLPTLSRAQESARTLKCCNNLRGLGQAVTLYRNDNDGYFPRSSHTAGSLTNPRAWLQSLQTYDIFKATRLCPSDPYRSSKLTSYATNDHFEPLVAGIDFNPFTHLTLPGGRAKAYTRFDAIPRPYAVVYATEMLGEGTIDHIHSVGWTVPSEVERSIAVTRHRRAANYLYADGRATTIAWRELSHVFSVTRNFLDPQTAQ